MTKEITQIAIDPSVKRLVIYFNNSTKNAATQDFYSEKECILALNQYINNHPNFTVKDISSGEEYQSQGRH